MRNWGQSGLFGRVFQNCSLPGTLWWCFSTGPGTRTAVSLLLLTAGLLKAHELLWTPGLMVRGLAPSDWLWIGSAQFELLLGLWFALGIALRYARVLALILFLCFACASAVLAVYGNDGECGCFGRIPVKSWQMFVVDILVMAGLVVWRPRSAKWTAKPDHAAVVATIVLSFEVVLAIALLANQSGELNDWGSLPENRIVVLEPEQWVGRRFPLLEYVVIDQDMGHGAWLVILFRAGCGRCKDILTRLRCDPRLRAGTLAIAVIEVPPYADESVQLMQSFTQFVFGRLTAERDWFVQTPVVLRLDNGVVKEVQASAAAAAAVGN